jgi:prevent-host-death family protein
MVRRLTISAARREFAEMVNLAHYGQEVTVLTKHGKDIAAVVPVTHPSFQDSLPPKKLPKRLK